MANAMTVDLALALLRDRDGVLTQGQADQIALLIEGLRAAVTSSSSLATQAGLSELTTWKNAGICLPDADLTVNIVVEDEDHEPVWLGYFDGEVWRSVDGGPITSPAGEVWRGIDGKRINGRVTYWSDMLAGPAPEVR